MSLDRNRGQKGSRCCAAEVDAQADYRLESSHPVVLRIVLDLGQSQRFHHWRHVHAEAATKTLLQAIPAANRILRRASPGFYRAFGRGLLLVRAAQRHPISVLPERRMKIVDAAEVVSKLGLADGHNECRRGQTFISVCGEFRCSWRRLQQPRISLCSFAFGHDSTVWALDFSDYKERV